MSIVTIEQLFDLQDKELGVSNWLTIDQAMINAFADVTRDWQFIHIDTEKPSKLHLVARLLMVFDFIFTIGHGGRSIALCRGTNLIGKLWHE